MKESRLSNENASLASETAIARSSLRVGRVDAIFENEGTVDVRTAPQSHVNCEVLTTTDGDEWFPEIDERVAFLKRGEDIPLIVGTPPSDPPTIVEGERIIGHSGSDTRVRFHNDGTLEILPDGGNGNSIYVDSAGIHFATGEVMTDVSTTKDADGHVTSVDPVYTDTISLQ